jgi:hypothetical protein
LFSLLGPCFVGKSALMHNEWRFWVLVFSVISRWHGGFLVFGFWFLVFGFWFLVFGFWFLVFGFWFTVAAALYSARDAIPPYTLLCTYSSKKRLALGKINVSLASTSCLLVCSVSRGVC